MIVEPVTLESRWYQILGEKKEDMPDHIRRERWDQWKGLASESQAPDRMQAWTEPNVECLNCRHLDGDWCKYAQLPCNVNPVLTFWYNDVGMACQGIGFEGKQQEIFK